MTTATAAPTSAPRPAPAPGGTEPTGRLPRLALGVLRSLLSTALSLAVVLAAWKAFLVVFDVDPFIGRGPEAVWRYLVTDLDAAANRTLLWEASKITLRDAGLGLVAGSAAAVVAALVFTLRREVEQTFLPIAMVLRSVPLVAMTPLIALIFGRGLLGVTIIAGIVTFFPTLVNVSLGLRSTPREAIDLCRAYGATPWYTLRRVQLPNALPALFASLRIAAPLALVGGLLAEWLATGDGLGYLMLESISTFKIDQLWSGVALVTTYSVVLYYGIASVERLVLARFGDGRTAR